MERLKRLIPLLAILESYGKDDLRGDISAGLTVGVMLIPQGMAYAMIAGLPPIYGLYASLVPLVIYGLLGSSRQLAVGPVAMVSLLVAAGVSELADPETPRYIELAIMLAFIVGGIQFIMGVGKLGFLVNFLSHPVLSGFTSAAALIIGLSQLKHLLGIPIPRSHFIHEILWNALRNIENVHIPTLLIGLGGIILLIGIRRWKPILPGALIVVILGTLVTWGLGLYELGVKVVGEVPQGLPQPYIPRFNMADIQALMPTALAIALVGFMESIAVAKAVAAKHGYEVNANQELIALGLANIGGGFFRSYPVTGGFSRTAVNDQAGARSGIASIISAGVIALTLLFLTPLFYYLPKAVLASIIMVAVFGLIDIKEAKFLWRVKRKDFYLMLVAFLATLSLGIEQGILVAVVISLILVIHRSAYPHIAVLGQLPGTTHYRNIDRYPDAVTIPGVIIIRIDAALYFANIEFVKDFLRKLELQSEVPIKAVIIDASGINDIDASAVHGLMDIVKEYQSRGIKLYFANVKGPVLDVMKRAGLVDMLGENAFFMDVHTAVSHVVQELGLKQPEASEAGTPSTH